MSTVVSKTSRYATLGLGLSLLGCLCLSNRASRKAQFDHYSIEHIKEAILWVSPQGDILDANPSACEMLEYEREELLGQTLMSVTKGLSCESWQENWQCLKSVGTATLEAVQQRKDGSTFPVEITANYLEYEGDEYGCMFIRDISERKQAERALRASLEEVRDLRLTLDESVVLAVTDVNFRIVYVNDKFCELAIYSRDELLGQSFHLLRASELSKTTYQTMVNQVSEGCIFHEEIQHQAKDGSSFWLDVTVVPFIDSDSGVPYQYVFIATDITDKKRMIEEVMCRARQQEAVAEFGLKVLKTADIVELMRECDRIVVETLQAEGTIIFEAQPGYEELKLVSCPKIPDYQGFIVDLQANTQMGYTFRTGKPVVVENSIKEKRFTIHPLYFKHGIMSGLSVVIYGPEYPYGVLGVVSTQPRKYTEDDVHFVQSIANILSTAIERQRASDQLALYTRHLEQSNQDLEDFAVVASHDLKEPLRKIVAFSNRLQELTGGKIGADAFVYMERIEKSCRQMQSLVDGLLRYSRITTKTQPFTVVDLNTVVAEVLEQFDVQLEQQHSVVTVESLPTIQAEPIQMHQLFQNLIGNAIKFKKPDQPLLLHIQSRLTREPCADGAVSPQASPCYEISISDNGLGFEERFSEQIFRLFERLKAPGAGSGVGLAICRKIILRHGGTIFVKSTPGVGSTFYVRLPEKQDVKTGLDKKQTVVQPLKEFPISP